MVGLRGTENFPVTKRYLVTFTNAMYVIFSGALFPLQFEHFSNTRLNAYTGTIGGCSSGVCGAFDSSAEEYGNQNIRQARHGPPTSPFSILPDLCPFIRKTTRLIAGVRNTRAQIVREYYISACATTRRWA